MFRWMSEMPDIDCIEDGDEAAATGERHDAGCLTL